ncbi:hypothetical protein [Maliponia aquimaris]|uniref:Uncharacterized protein n=1 Tax=Maliponia aquimaris TaxID=1673631 RepID=A0A238L5M0_9RHOB|nr:hypothetical protein [Maliponia aquimaris]SMX50278.1 hypothetical protein MAA8898_04690 [Maliponia aquimaris]
MLGVMTDLRAPLLAAILPLALAGAQAQADMWQDRDALRQALAGYRDAGLMTPMDADLDRYSDAALVQALAITRGAPGGTCERAVQAALYLDAQRAPDAAEVVTRRGYDSGLLADLGAVWQHPEGGDVFDPLAWGWSPALWTTVAGLDEVLPSREAFVAGAVRKVTENRDAWVQEVVSLGLESGWDGAELVHAEARLDYAALRALEWVRSTESWTRTRIEAADDGFRRGLEQAEGRWQQAQRDLRQEVGDWRYDDPQDAAVVFRKAEIDNLYRADRASAHAARAARITEALQVRTENLAMALEDLARARVQKAAVLHYLGPILAGACETLAPPAAPGGAAPRP